MRKEHNLLSVQFCLQDSPQSPQKQEVILKMDGKLLPILELTSTKAEEEWPSDLT